MKIFKQAALIASLLLSSLGSLFGGSAFIAPIEAYYDGAALVVIVEVRNVTKVVVSTGDDQTSDIYVAEAEVLQTLKSDHNPTPEKRKIAIVGSTIPMSTAVWEPIENRRYLAFLNPEQGHYRYGEKYAMRPISPEGRIDWLQKNSNGDFEIIQLDLDEAIKRIKANKSEQATPRKPSD